MPKSKEKISKNNIVPNMTGVEKRLEAIIVLLLELPFQNKDLYKRAKEKAVALLVAGGLSKKNAAKLLGIRH